MEQGIEQAVSLRDLCKAPSVLPRLDQIEGLVYDAIGLIEAPGKDITSGVSHCIRTPLTTLLGIQDIVQRGLPLSEAQRESFLRIVLFESARLRRFVEMLMWYHETWRGTFSLSPHTADLRETVLRSVRSFDPEALTKSVRIVVEPMPSPRFVVADHSRLKHAFEQLIQNALHVSPKGGDIRISAFDTDDMVSVSVTNAGPVLSGEQCSSVFEPFKRYPHPDDTGSELGLGLTVVRSIARFHQGLASCSPADIPGMTFTIAVPR